MAKRIIWGVVTGSVLVFLVSSIWQAGLEQVGIPNEEVLFPAMRASIHSPGFYFFPAMNPGGIRHDGTEKRRSI
jgi:hypothetical protein